ncbi:hypothetical protein GPJ56_005420 [Histomonas meleagridis]|uniref:uncharacterized protein n=1 Tax=Histomonas meleagridis TaxID=135588 RepID=UPI003559CD2C|nr:hypothetical protein GPJ56_005420 [Histomonas meleagridis]KAH0801809.1 hypothetical protein GO595_005376 [Histomonas meleagridis]
MSPLCAEYLRRFFRSLDTDFDGKIFLSDLSAQNNKVFGCDFSDEDYCSIFQIINGSTPLYVSTVKSLRISFESFFKLMQYLIDEGYTHVVYKLIHSTEFHNYLSNQTQFVFHTPAVLNSNGTKFVRSLFDGLSDNPSRDEVLELFALQGGAPQRFVNMRRINIKDWVNAWHDWFRLEPSEAAHHLLAFGFPKEKLLQSIGYETQSSNPLLPIVVTGVVTVAAAFSFLYLKLRNNRN